MDKFWSGIAYDERATTPASPSSTPTAATLVDLFSHDPALVIGSDLACGTCGGSAREERHELESNIVTNKAPQVRVGPQSSSTVATYHGTDSVNQDGGVDPVVRKEAWDLDEEGVEELFG
jgi:hypothetical protein